MISMVATRELTLLNAQDGRARLQTRHQNHILLTEKNRDDGAAAWSPPMRLRFGRTVTIGLIVKAQRHKKIYINPFRFGFTNVPIIKPLEFEMRPIRFSPRYIPRARATDRLGNRKAYKNVLSETR
jgi:hypothetical protein